MTDQREDLAKELEQLCESANAALRNLHGLPALATESDTQPGKTAIWMDNGLAGVGQVAISTGEFPCVQTEAICVLVNVGALFADKLSTILTALKTTPNTTTADHGGEVASEPDDIDEFIEEWSDCGNLGWCGREGKCTRHNYDEYRQALRTRHDTEGAGQ